MAQAVAKKVALQSAAHQINLPERRSRTWSDGSLADKGPESFGSHCVVLYERKITAVAYEELVAALYPESINPDAAIVEIDMSIRQLRTQLELIPTNSRLIVTLPAYGYILVGPPV